ncbi:UNVERIFIED_CONTAM: hypothetical protein K2H54_051914 [Gekko kuhli]
MFTLLFRDVEVKASVRDDPREFEKIQQMQIDKNFDNWLSAYTIYMGVVMQVHRGHSSELVKYLDLIHRAYKEYSGAAWLCYNERFHSQEALDPSGSGEPTALMPMNGPHESHFRQEVIRGRRPPV